MPTVETILKWLGASDAAILAMGPSTAIILAWAFGIATTQWLKFPISRMVEVVWYDWAVRTTCIVVTALWAWGLSDKLSLAVKLGTGVGSIAAYHVMRAAVRKWAPWLEVNKAIGSVTPPQSAIDAAASHKAQ